MTKPRTYRVRVTYSTVVSVKCEHEETAIMVAMEKAEKKIAAGTVLPKPRIL